jgi:hypothetical protein
MDKKRLPPIDRQTNFIHLPPNVIEHIRKYAKPLTRPDWKTRPTFTFEQFFHEIKKQNKYILKRFYYRVVMGYCHHFMLDKYREYNKNTRYNKNTEYNKNTRYNKEMALNKLYLEYGLEPKIICLMCNIL